MLPLNSDRFPFEGRGQRAQATRLERNDGSTVTASGLGLNSHTPPSAVHTARCVPRRIACRTYRRMRERWCLAHIRRPPGQLEAPTSSCQLRIANVTWSTLLKSHRAARQLLAQHEAGGRYLPSSISTNADTCCPLNPVGANCPPPRTHKSASWYKSSPHTNCCTCDL